MKSIDNKKIILFSSAISVTAIAIGITIFLGRDRCFSQKTGNKKMVALDHPRLFFDSNDVPDLRARAKTTHQDIFLPILEYIDFNLGPAPPSFSPADGDLQTYRNFGNSLIALAFVAAITESPRYQNQAVSCLMNFAKWKQWGENNHRDLGHAHMLLGNSLAYDWLYNYLTPEERNFIRKSLGRWAEKMYEASVGPKEEQWDNWWYNSYVQNHFSTNNSALGIAGLTLYGEDKRAPKWVDHARDKLSRWQYILEGIEDGSWHEGIRYQSYGLTLTLPFLVNLRKILQTDIFPHTYLKNFSHWRMYNYLPNSTQNILAYGNFEWAWGNGYQSQNILRFIANEYDDPQAEWVAKKLIDADKRHAKEWVVPWYVFEFLYYNPDIIPQPLTYLPKARTFPDLEGIIWRTGWDDRDLVFSLKSGPHGGRFAFDSFTQELYPWEAPYAKTRCQLNIGHNHDDTNTFSIYRNGHWLAPETVGVNQSSTTLHNTLLIDGKGQYRPTPYWKDKDTFTGSDGFLEATANSPHFNYLASDATRRYKNIEGINDVTRHVTFIRPDYFLMVDNINSKSNHRYEWVCHFEENVSLEENWVRGESGDGQILGVGIAAPKTFETIIGNDGNPYIRIRGSSLTSSIRLINLLFPTDVNSWDTRPTIDVAFDNNDVSLVKVQLEGGNCHFNDILLSYHRPVSVVSAGGYVFDGQIAVVSGNENGNLDRIFTYGGTYLKDQKRDVNIVSNLSRNDSFEANYVSSNTLIVHSTSGNEVTIFAPDTRKLMVNGQASKFIRSGDFITFTVMDKPVVYPKEN